MERVNTLVWFRLFMELQALTGLVPAVLAVMGSGESIYCEHGIMLYKDPEVSVDRKTIKTGGFMQTMERTTVGGVPYFLSEFKGPGNVCLSRDGVGDVRVLELGQNEVLDVAEGSLLCADGGIKYEMLHIKGTHRPGGMSGVWMDQLTGPGKIAIHGYGDIITMTLAAGEIVTCDMGSLLYKSGSVQAQTKNLPFGGGLLGKLESFEVLELVGPGRVALQSVDPRSKHY
jgi:uncharacterized protein (AIM24 family)